MERLEKSISRQRNNIAVILTEPLSLLAAICAEHWSNRSTIDFELKRYLENKPDHRCRLLYAVDINGLQYSSNISGLIIDDVVVGQDLSYRPYLNCIAARIDCVDTCDQRKLILSDVYIDKQTRRPCLTALHRVTIENEVVGFIAADFDLKNLPLENVDEATIQEWRQIKGDPSIRDSLFKQTRTPSAMDECLSEVLDVIDSLITEQGIFHAKIHFSSSRATLWPYNDPYNYRLHVLEEIISPKVCLVYEKINYPEQASISCEMVPKILKMFEILRTTDEVIYLRAASMNIINGVVGLNFSCDGSHYMSAEEFLSRDIGFWFGEGENNEINMCG